MKIQKNITKSELKDVISAIKNLFNADNDPKVIKNFLNKLSQHLNKTENKEIITLIDTFQKSLNKDINFIQLKDLLDEVDDILEKETLQNTAIITTAQLLDQDQKKEIENALQKIYSEPLNFQFIVNPQILAGMKIKVYDHVVDMSIDEVLMSMGRTLKH